MKLKMKGSVGSLKKPVPKLKIICIVTLISLVSIYLWLSISAFEVTIIPKDDQCNRLADLQPFFQGNKSIKQILILVWTWPFGEHFPLDTCLSKFGVPGCKLTVDRKVSDHADAIIIHHFDIMDRGELLPKGPRPHYQRWIWFNLESPVIANNLDMLDNLMNMTMTYRQDSDIFIPYGYLKPVKERQTFRIPTKTKLVAWVVSKWYPDTSRVHYYEELKKHIQIDVYGEKHMPLSWMDFAATLEKYKFYLAFENCEHKDYISETLWRNAFGNGIVPVVLGSSRENYERFIPPDSFIHVNDFSSPKDLAEFLLDLDKDDVKYMRYFNWRAQHVMKREIGWENHFCKACAALHKTKGHRVISSIAKWFLSK
uniref:Fucosyltransferase n=1 Tax=Leptobrachium leishanense TaxID=445787 RepID=A0A8C5Q9L9_9ANUR